MPSTHLDLNDAVGVVNRAFAPVIGLPCWNAKHGWGSFITFEFGQPHLVIREPIEAKASASPVVRRLLSKRQVTPHGEWHLWIYSCNWIVTANGERVGESTSARRMDKAARELCGQALIDVTGDPQRGRWCFDFDFGGRLETRPYGRNSRHYHPDALQWRLYEPSGLVLAVRADGSYSWKPANEA